MVSTLAVAQSFTLLYRRVVLGTAIGTGYSVGLSPGPQSATLRYIRVQLCATIAWCRLNRDGRTATHWQFSEGEVICPLGNHNDACKQPLKSGNWRLSAITCPANAASRHSLRTFTLQWRPN